MSNYHRSTRWTGISSRSPGSSLTSEPASNKSTTLNSGTAVGSTIGSSGKGKLTVSSTSQRQQRAEANNTVAEQTQTTATTQPGDVPSSSATSSTQGLFSGAGSGAVLRSSTDVDQVSAGGRSNAQTGQQVDLSSTQTTASGWDGYRNDQLVAFPAVIGNESEVRDTPTPPASGIASATTTPGQGEATAAQEATSQSQSLAGEASSGGGEQSGAHSPIRRGPSSAALASRRLADALENDEVGALYNAYREEWSPEPINTAPDPSRPMQQHRPASASSILPASEGHYRTASGGITSFSSGQGEDHSHQHSQQQGSHYQHVSRAVVGSSRASLQGISEVHSASGGPAGEGEAPPPRPPPPADGGTMSAQVGQVAVSQPPPALNISDGGENIKMGTRQFQGPVSRNRKPILGSDTGVIQGLNNAARNGSIPNSDFHLKPMAQQGFSDTEVAYSEAYFRKGKPPVNGGVNHVSMPPTALQSPTSSQTSTMVTVNTAVGQVVAERSSNSTPTLPNRYSTFRDSTQAATTVGQSSNTSTLPTDNGSHLASGSHGNQTQISPSVTMARSYGSRQAIAAIRQSGTSTPRYIAAGERSSPPESTYYENTDGYPTAAAPNGEAESTTQAVTVGSSGNAAMPAEQDVTASTGEYTYLLVPEYSAVPPRWSGKLIRSLCFLP